MSAEHRAVVAGGGVAGLEAALALRALAGDRVQVTMLSPTPTFVYRPLAVAGVFDEGAVLEMELAGIAEEAGFELRDDGLAAVVAHDHRVTTFASTVVEYDSLVLALGARAEVSVPGALTFRGPEDVTRLNEALLALSPGEVHRLVFIAPSGATWTLPLYELALLTTRWGSAHGVDLEITVVTAESRPLGVFGDAAVEEVEPLLAEAGVEVRTASFATSVEDERVWLELEGGLPADLAVALPRLVGRSVPGLRSDDWGFVPVDGYGRVPDLPDVYAVGDMTSRPLRQGGLAAQQADVVAGVIAARAGAPVVARPYEPVLRGLLLTGRESRFLRRAASPRDAGDTVSQEPLWWPPQKIFGRHLAVVLARHADWAARSSRGSA